MLLVEVTGELDVNILAEALKDIYDDPRSSTMKNSLIDFSKTKSFQLKTEHALTPASYAIGNQVDKFFEHHRALVISDASRDFALNYQSIFETQPKINVGIFDKVSDAKAWLSSQI